MAQPDGVESRKSRPSGSTPPDRTAGPPPVRGAPAPERLRIYRCTPMRRRCGMFSAGRERSWWGSLLGGRGSRCAGFGAGTGPVCGGRRSGVLAEPSSSVRSGRCAGRSVMESSIRSLITTAERAPRLNERFEEPALIHPPFIVRPRIAGTPMPRRTLAQDAAQRPLDWRSRAMDAPPRIAGAGRSASPHTPSQGASAPRRQGRWRVGPPRHEPSGSVLRASGQRARACDREVNDLQRIGLVRMSATLRPNEHTTHARAGRLRAAVVAAHARQQRVAVPTWATGAHPSGPRDGAVVSAGSGHN